MVFESYGMIYKEMGKKKRLPITVVLQRKEKKLKILE